MRTQHTAVGTCPFCGSEIPPGNVLIRYETDDGTATYAECPDCGEVVHPQ